MRRPIQVPALILCLGWIVATGAAEGPAPTARVVERSDHFIAVEVRIPGQASATVDRDGGPDCLEIDGLTREALPEGPGFPALVYSVEIPPDGEIELSWSTAEPGDLPSFPMATCGDATTEPVSMEIVRYRDLRIARLLIRPVSYDAERKRYRITRSFDLRLGLGEPPESPAPSGIEEPAGRARAATVGQAMSIHVEAEGLLRITASELSAAGFDTNGLDPRNLELSYRGQPVPCRIVGESDGVFDATDVFEFYGVPGTGRYSTTNVYRLELTDGAGLRYATRDASPSGAPQAGVFTERVRYEEGNSVYTFGKPAEEGDPHFFWKWFEDNPNPPRVTQFTHTVVLPGVTTGPSAALRAFLAGRTNTPANPDHRVRFEVNGVEIGETLWEGQTFHTASVPFDPALLTGGWNDFTLTRVEIASPDIYYLDWIEVDYPRTTQASGDRLTIRGEDSGPVRYDVDNLTAVSDPVVLDVSNPWIPVALTGFTVTGSGPFQLSFEEPSTEGRRYLVVGDGGREAAASLVLDTPSDLRSPALGADLIVIVPEGWESSLGALVAHRENQGLRVVLANLADVADEFAGGNVDDLAIRDFVAWTYANWQPPAVSHLLLVGEPNLDARNDLEQSPHFNFMPTHFGVTGAQGETLSDTWFGAVAGGDLLPDVSVGRFSVRSAAQAAAVAAKIIDYENLATGSDPWNNRVMLVASDEQEFEDALETAASSVPPQFVIDRQYRRNGAGGSSIRSAFDTGAVASAFLGHGNVQFWADSPGGPFFDNDDADLLANDGRLPFVIALNCLNGLIGQPFVVDSLSETFHNLEASGALGFFSPSGLGFLDEYTPLQSKLFQTIFVDHTPRLGDATLAALVDTYLTTPVGIDLVTKMILLGDPSGWLAIDVDADALLDQAELDAGLDPSDRDSDDDGLLDGAEPQPEIDTDLDGMANALDADADNDGLTDGLESGIVVADGDTDSTRGFFVPDQDPATTTDPLLRDSDGGGAPDGTEDSDANGAVGPEETDPDNGSDDPQCVAGPPPEIAGGVEDRLLIEKEGADLTIEWGPTPAGDPCTLYRLYVADELSGDGGDSSFRLLTVTGSTSFLHPGAAVAGTEARYLVAGETLLGGEGPWGHFGR